MLKIAKANSFKIRCDNKVIVFASFGKEKHPHKQTKQHWKQTINATSKHNTNLRSLLFQIESLKFLDILNLTFMQMSSFIKLY